VFFEDPGFSLSDAGKEATVAASGMLEAFDKIGEDQVIPRIVQEIVHLVKLCASHGSRMWGVLLQTRSSTQFLTAWERLMMLTLGKRASPIFFQYLTDSIFKEMVKQKHPPPQHNEAVEPIPPLTYEEENALYYAAGYVIRHLRQRIEKGSSPLKGLLVCLEDMCNSDDERDCSASWTTKISRGHLIHVNSNLYCFFRATEMKLRQLLRVSCAESFSGGMKSQLVEIVCTDEDVLFFWCILSAEWRMEEEEALLQLIAELWVTIRGFSFARSFMELYKQRKKKTLEKSKALRKTLN